MSRSEADITAMLAWPLSYAETQHTPTGTFEVLRVPGGWLYTAANLIESNGTFSNLHTPCFVPEPPVVRGEQE